MAPTALILAGAGMLSDLARTLVIEGWRVVLPSRRYSPVPVDGDPEPEGRAVWVEAHWDEPRELARRVEATLRGDRADLLVTWLHDAYRQDVVAAVEPLLSASAPVVELRSRSADGVPEQADAGALAGRPTQYVLLGDVSAEGDRPLGHGEIAAGVRAAVARARAGSPSSRHEIGRRRRSTIPRPRVHGVAGSWLKLAPRVG
ncbi:hypothetical protein B1813_06620 [Saccharomonospora piscinae]|uniref:Short chain dehydrogenase n=1 Tax=Saccharomonospora piscinae TaxID=687388 RepID=A0A1V9A481_SACPI|nr:hypothetical protein [Saccharomonospora piscinae]OQO91952.1 hypothetical protein B1813_06620 [Saccharomonospora piscinae]